MDDVIEEAYMEGRFKVKVGNKVVAKGRNKWTRYFATTIVEHFIGVEVDHGYWSGTAKVALYDIAWHMDARVGKDTSTPTDPSMTDLVQKEDIAPSSKSRIMEKDDFMTEYKITYIFEWNTGVLPSMTIGEFGVYGFVGDDSWSSPATNPNPYTEFERSGYWKNVIRTWNADKRLIARISSGDGDFEPIDYDNTKVLRLEWAVIIRS